MRVSEREADAARGTREFFSLQFLLLMDASCLLACLPLSLPLSHRINEHSMLKLVGRERRACSLGMLLLRMMMMLPLMRMLSLLLLQLLSFWFWCLCVRMRS